MYKTVTGMYKTVTGMYETVTGMHKAVTGMHKAGTGLYKTRCRIRRFCAADTQEVCVSTARTPMRALPCTLSIPYYTVTGRVEATATPMLVVCDLHSVCIVGFLGTKHREICKCESLRPTWFWPLYCHCFANTVQYYVLSIEYRVGCNPAVNCIKLLASEWQHFGNIVQRQTCLA